MRDVTSFARLKSNSHAPNLHACIIYIRVFKIYSWYVFLRMRTQIHTGVNLHSIGGPVIDRVPVIDRFQVIRFLFS